MPETETPIPASPNFEKLKAKLRELFELDKADLDFGIYRVLRQRHREITEFLDKHLEKTVRNALTAHGDLQSVLLKNDLEKAEAAAAGAGIAPEHSPRVMELRDKLAKGADLEATADEVYSHLLTFFSRYYQGGDFLGLHRSTVHGREKYMIPYNGEEVKLIWANMDQYYIKSSELLRDYNFKVSKNLGEIFKADSKDIFTVQFKLIEGDTEKDNRKADSKSTRAFSLDTDTAFVEADERTLTLHFRYREHPSERSLQDKLNADTEKTLADALPPKWKELLFAADPSYQPKDKKDSRTIFQKHLRSYTAKHLFDYFIHKDLGGFLRRELDFYVKNEVMHLDDIENSTAAKAEEYLSKIRAIRRCATPVIQMIAQLEEFQKKLWLKKKFVVETRYCLTLDRVPETLYPDICTADAQWQEWDELVALSELKPKRTPEFLRAQPHLMLDTRHFSREFMLKLLASVENIDASLDGVCFHSENFQALQLMQERYREQVKCVYIDPPYNTEANAILYKNNYRHSSWLSLLRHRLLLSGNLERGDVGVHCIAIDEVEKSRLALLLPTVFSQRELSCVSVIHNPGGTMGMNFSRTNEYALFVYDGAHSTIAKEDRADNPDVRDLMNTAKGASGNYLRATGKTCFYPIYVKDLKVVGFGDVCADDYHPPQNIIGTEGVIEVFPIDSDGVERKWVLGRDTVEECVHELFPKVDPKTGNVRIERRKSEINYKTVWTDGKYSAKKYGTELLGHIIPLTRSIPPLYPKSVFLVKDCLHAGTNDSQTSLICDYFAGSGTTAHAAIETQRSGASKYNYLLVEMGKHFETVLVPRLKKVVYGSEWANGKPRNRDTGISQAFKIVRLESYEDTLNNLHLHRTPEQTAALAQGGETNRDQYLLGYFLDVESAGSKSLLDLAEFRDPFAYKLNIATSSAGETRETTVDLVETFNWLLGLKVKHIDTAKGFLTVTGEKRAGGRCLILWRTLSPDSKADNESLEKFLTKLAVNPADTEFEFIYVNGAHTLNDPHNKVHLIEETFQRLMFDTTNFESLS